MVEQEKAGVTNASLVKHSLAVMVLAIGLLVGLGGWAAMAKLAGAVVATGRVVVEGNSKKIQHLSGGIVSEIKVAEGDRVDAGQILLRLSDTIVQANLSIVENTLAQLYSRRARLRAEITEASSFTVPEDLVELTNPKAARTFIDSEQGLFNSRLSALTGMKNSWQRARSNFLMRREAWAFRLQQPKTSLPSSRKMFPRRRNFTARGS